MTQLLKILFVEDIPTDQELAERELRFSELQFSSMVVETREAYIQALDEFQPDLVISDYAMPEFDGMQALELTQQLYENIPFILLTGAMNEEIAVSCMKAGATNYVLKEHLHRLPFAVQDALQQRRVRMEKLQAEKQLRESEAKFKEMFEAANVGKSLTLLTGEINVNQAFCDLLGYTHEELKNKTWQELTVPEDIEPTQNEITRLMGLKIKATRFNKRYFHKNGSIVWADVSVAMRYDSEGKPLHFITTIVDITDRVLAEKALRDSENRYRNLILYSPDAIFINHQDKVILVNEACIKLFGATSADDLIGKSPYDLFHPDYHQQIQDRIQQLGNLHEPVAALEEKIVRLDGGVVDVDVREAPFFFNDFNDIHVILRDITGRKQAEAQLMKQSRELQRSNIELACLYRTSGSLISPKPFDLLGLAQTIMDTVVQEFDSTDCCSLYVLKAQTGELSRLAYAGTFSDQNLCSSLILDGPGLVPLAIRTRRIINVPDVHLHPEHVIGWTQARSELVIPLIVNDHVVGALDLESDQLANFTPDDEKLLQAFANQAAVALENTQLVAETTVQVQRLQSLRKIDETINASLDLGITTSLLLEQIMNQLQVDAADILLFSPFTKNLTYINGRGFNTPALQHTDLRLGQGLAGIAANDRKAVHITDLSARHEFFKDSPFLKEEHFSEYYGIPLISKGTLKGLLEIFHRSPLQRDESWMDFMGTLAGQAAIAIDNILMFDNLQRSNNELVMAYDATIEGWSHTLDLRDKETEGHTQRVTEITVRMAKAIGVHGEELLHIRRGALLHDIGKMGISDNILLKPGMLTDEEWAIMRKHAVYAFELLSPIVFLKPALDIPYCHHEKWDGSGYPRGLKGEQIPLSARLFAVADVWDALTSNRPYREAWPESQAIEYIRDQNGKHFDPQAVEVFLNSFLAEESPWVKPTILIVDDEESVTRSLTRSLRDQFTVLTANSGADALKIVERSDPAVVLTDQRMPGMSGVELLERIRAIRPRTLGILISGYSDVFALTAAINLTTVRGFIPKPWDLEILRKKLEDVVTQYREMARGPIPQ